MESGNWKIADLERMASGASAAAAAEAGFAVSATVKPILANIKVKLDVLVDLIREARDSDDEVALLLPDDRKADGCRPQRNAVDAR